MLFPANYFSPTSPYNYFRASPTYNLPANVTLRDMLNLFELNQLVPATKDLQLSTPLSDSADEPLGRLQELADSQLTRTNGIVDVDINALQFLESLQKQPREQSNRINYTP